MGYDIKRKDIQALLNDEKLMAKILKKVTGSKEILESLADDIASELASAIESDPEAKKRIIKAAFSNPGFKRKILKGLADKLAGN